MHSLVHALTDLCTPACPCCADQLEPYLPSYRRHLRWPSGTAQPLHLRLPHHCHHHPSELHHHLAQQPGALFLRQRAIHELCRSSVLCAPNDLAVHQLLHHQLRPVCIDR